MTVCMEYPAIVRIQASELLVPFSLDADINTAILRTIQPMYPEYVHRVRFYHPTCCHGYYYHVLESNARVSSASGGRISVY